jgi:glycosyltransferase involved in cell wall biosynthesis
MSYHHDMTLLQREMVSTHFTLEPFTKRPRLFDVDDAIWLLRGGGFAKRLAGNCDSVICGNTFLAENFSKWNSRVCVIPTAVDTDRYVPVKPIEEPVIGWSGVSGGFHHLYAIESALSIVLEQVPGARIRIVSDSNPSFREIPRDRIEFVRWSQKNEVQAIQGMAIGIMPLEDSLWARGKCSYKMLTYMACGLPVVVSPVGTNAEILSYGVVGFGPRSAGEWISMLSFLCEDMSERIRLGEFGRQVVLERYSANKVTKMLAKFLLKTVEG